MNYKQFLELHDQCSAMNDAYFAEAQKTSLLLRQCTLKPLAFKERFAVLSQEIAEEEAQRLYLEAKRRLHRAALLGYGAITQDSCADGKKSTAPAQ